MRSNATLVKKRKRVTGVIVLESQFWSFQYQVRQSWTLETFRAKLVYSQYTPSKSRVPLRINTFTMIQPSLPRDLVRPLPKPSAHPTKMTSTGTSWTCFSHQSSRRMRTGWETYKDSLLIVVCTTSKASELKEGRALQQGRHQRVRVHVPNQEKVQERLRERRARSTHSL